MFSKTRESKGFTLVELMTVVAIMSILAAVAVPYYQKYIQKSRLTNKVFPGIHTIETNVAAYYSLQRTFPGATEFTPLTGEANTQCFSAAIASGGTPVINFVINAHGGVCTELQAMDNSTLSATPQVSGGLVTGWRLSGSLASQLGLSGEE
jgi:type IV pilus assembly protein PilA